MEVKMLTQPSSACENLLEQVDAYEHPELVERLKRKIGISHTKAQLLFSDTKRFLYLCATNEQPLGPTKAIDAGWHEFLMYTREYSEFCIEILGKFIHHVPTPVLTNDHVVRKVNKTQQLASDTFENISENWICVKNASVDCDDSCNHCESGSCAPGQCKSVVTKS